MGKGSSNFKRHVRTCKGKKSKTKQIKKIMCTYCNKSFRRDYYKKHMDICKSGKNVNRLQLLETLESFKNENKSLQSQLINLQIQMCREKEILRVQLCKEKDDNRALCTQLSDTKDQLAQQELEFTKQLAIRAKPAVHNHYHQYTVHMTPWCIDPADPSYERFLVDDVSAMQKAMSSLPPRPTADEYLDEFEALKRQKIFSDLVKKNLAGVKPRYIVADQSRNKGMFLMPDGTARVDRGLAMMMQHQFKVGLGVANNMYIGKWWFQDRARKNFESMISSCAGNGAVRLKQLKKK